MSTSRVPTLTVLFLALLLGAAPWRVCAHGEHGGVWMPAVDAHAHGDSFGASHGRTQAGGAQARGASACAQRHGQHVHGACSHRCTPRGARQGPLPVQAETPPSEPGEDQGGKTCHCDDQPLVVGLRLAPVQVAAPQFAGWLDGACDTLLSADPIAIEPRPLAWGRVACEEDSIVLLR